MMIKIASDTVFVLTVCIVAMQNYVEVASTPPMPDIHNATREASQPARRSFSDTNTDRKVDTSARLARLREQMRKMNISAYIVLATDDHQSEFTSEHDRRRAFISGFTGSSGDAVVTLNSAALWTDSRYYIQADNQLDGNWLLMRSGDPKTPTIDEWIVNQLNPGESASTDPRICTCKRWKLWSEKLGKKKILMKLIRKNLIDEIWDGIEDRPVYPPAPIIILDVKFAGLTWQEKLKIIRDDMDVEKVEVLVLTALDEIAWMLNLRGGEVPFTPVFRSYMIIEMNRATVYIPTKKVTRQIMDHLNSKGEQSGDSVRIADYTDVWTDLEKIGRTSKIVGLPTSYSYAGGVSHLVSEAILPENIKSLTSPVLLRKNIKNTIEVAGMKASHIRDSVALCQFLMKMEMEVGSGAIGWTEMKAVKVLDDLRSKQEFNMGPSFGTISAFGKNAAMPHYEPTLETNSIIDNKQLYMVDSGGQYLDGTTDVTRTVHFGSPRQIEREIYTRLLIGCINLATVVFKKGYTLLQLEILVRQPLFEVGLDYGHGSTHGVGSFLGVHEAFNSVYSPNFFGSQEPGYYKENEFGMRLENVVTVVVANTTKHTNQDFYTFETVTLVPYERKMIVTEMLEQKHLDWINEYHQKVREQVGGEMLKQGLQDAYKWLIQKTQPIYK